MEDAQHIYELTAVVKGDIDPGISALISNLGGKILAERSLGKRKLVYPIKKEPAGHFLIFEFKIAVEKLKELDRKLNLNDRILRALTIKRFKKAVPASLGVPSLPEKEIIEKISRKAKEKKVEEPPVEEKVSEKERLKKLEEKLGEILKE